MNMKDNIDKKLGVKRPNNSEEEGQQREGSKECVY